MTQRETDQARREHPRRCRHCETELRGPFCHRCGQEDRDFDVPFLDLVKTAADDLFGLDTRLWRTLRPLVSRPGFLTREYFAGRLVPYVPPFKLYIVISAFFFIILALTNSTVVHQVDRDGQIATGSGFNFRVTTSPPPPAEDSAGDVSESRGEQEIVKDVLTNEKGTFEATGPDRVEDGAEHDTQDAAEETWLERMLEKVEELAKQPDVLNRSFRQRLSQVLLILVPLFALFLRWLYRKKLKHYQHHLVFSLHVHSAIFLVLLFALPVDRLLGFPADGPVGRLAELWGLVYLFIALRRVYGESRWRTAFKMVVLLGAHTLAGLFAMGITLLWVVVSS